MTVAEHEDLEAENATLRAEVERLTSERGRDWPAELRASYRATVRALANAVEARDAYTGAHAERVAAYGMEIARAMGSALADDPEMEFGFLLHDVGKVAIPDAILFKPEPLTAAEHNLMERHTVIGAEILRGIDFLGEAKCVVRFHHERWDGTGYPDRLAGEEIPLCARVFAVADALDALTTERPYRSASTFAVARGIIREGAGTQFDPGVVAAYDTVADERFAAIQRDGR
jgi:ribonuclease P protein subunit RPR2